MGQEKRAYADRQSNEEDTGVLSALYIHLLSGFRLTCGEARVGGIDALSPTSNNCPTSTRKYAAFAFRLRQPSDRFRCYPKALGDRQHDHTNHSAKIVNGMEESEHGTSRQIC